MSKVFGFLYHLEWDHFDEAKKTVLFPETSQYFLGSVGRQFFFGNFLNFFYIGKV